MTSREKYNLNKDAIIKQRLSGRVVREIGEEFDIPKGSLILFLEKDGIIIPPKHKTEEYKKQILDLYNQGYNYHKIAEIVGSGHKTVKKLLLENGIRWRDTSEVSRKWKLNENYFDIIDTPNKAYILGFLYADGYNCLAKHSVRIALQEEDGYILEKMRQELESEKPLKYLDFNGQIRPNGYPCKNMYQLEVYGLHICKALEKQGMKQGKSLILQFPENLSEELYPHFIRGYFDGDGCIVNSIRKTGRIYCTMSFTSTEIFCIRLQEIFLKELPIIKCRVIDASCHNGVTKVLEIYGNERCKTLCDWLYKDAEMYLERKYQRFLELKNYLSNKQP